MRKPMFLTGLTNYRLIQSQLEPEDEPSDEKSNTREEWMVLSELYTPFDNSEQMLHSTHD